MLAKRTEARPWSGWSALRVQLRTAASEHGRWSSKMAAAVMDAGAPGDEDVSSGVAVEAPGNASAAAWRGAAALA